MQVSQANRLPIANPADLPLDEKKGLESRVHQAALQTFLKTAAALASNFLILQFMAQPLSVVAFTWALFPVMAITTVVLVANKIWGWNWGGNAFLRASQVLGDLAIVNNAGVLGPGIALHELGHALAGSALFTGAQPKISIKPFVGGVTNLNLAGPLTPLGLRLGLEGSVAVIAIAGLAASATVALVEFAVAHYTDEKSPEVSYFLRCQGFCQLLNEFANGLPALYRTVASAEHNDLVRFETLSGTKPALPLALLAVLPIAEHLILWATKVRKRGVIPPQTEPPRFPRQSAHPSA